jgi:Lon protease-like protein
MEFPLFPLNTVLFPGEPLPLHVFEQRYRTMIGTCLESDTPEFGVVLLRSGGEVVEGVGPNGADGPPPVPHNVGTTARIVDWRREPDGRYLLACLGRRRFRLTRLTQDAPYLAADVLPLDDPADAVQADLARQVREAAVRLLVLRAAGNVSAGDESEGLAAKVRRALPEDATALSFFVPRVLTIASNDQKQSLLEAGDADSRLRLELSLLLDEQAVAREMHRMARRASLN